MALIEDKILEGVGIGKTIDASAMQLMMRGAQEERYTYPEASFVREIASNCVDAIVERNNARAILTGEAAVEDYYRKSNSALTKDSEFDESYYDLKYMSEDNSLHITYQNTLGERDRLTFTDYGVGLGGSRLQGYFNLGYSTKRLDKLSLGKFGIGAKSGLATGVESFQMRTRHNGKEYWFTIYSDRQSSTVPKFADDGTINPHDIWVVDQIDEFGNPVRDENGHNVKVKTKVHYINTDKPNMVHIGIDVKNPAKRKATYIEAIKTQLMYFKDIMFSELNSNGDKVSSLQVSAEILYETEDFIIPKNSYYTKPHLVLNRVNYGVIDYPELELNEKYCNIGIKGDANKLSINQSRESIIYSDKSREEVLRYDEKVTEFATNLVSEELAVAESDFVRWLKVCNGITTKGRKSLRMEVLSRISGMVDVGSIGLMFKHGNLKLNYRSDFDRVFIGYTVNKILVNTKTTVTGKLTYTTATTRVTSWGQLTPEYLFYKHDRDQRMGAIQCGYIDENITDGSALYVISPNMDNGVKKSDCDMYHLVMASDSGFDVEEVAPSDEFMETHTKAQKEEEEEIQRKEKEASLSAKELRERDGLFLYYKVFVRTSHEHKTYELHAKTSQLSIDDASKHFRKNNTVYYTGTAADMELLKSVMHIGDIRRNEFTLQGCKVIKVSEANAKFINHHATHLRDAIQDLKHNTIHIMNCLKKYNTGKVFANLIESKDYAFLNGFKHIDEAAYKAMDFLYGYANEHVPNTLTPTENGKSVEEYLNKLAKFQLEVVKNPDPADLAKLAQEMFGNAAIIDCQALDLETYAIFKALEDFTEGMRKMLKPASTCPGEIDPETVLEYMAFKNISKFDEYLAIRREEFGLKNQ